MMKAAVSKKRPWRRDRRVPNPYRDTLSQEIGYRLDSRYAGCLLTALAIGLLLVTSLAFIIYWLMH
ncbi:MAG: hypothetical protein PHP93_08430 [Kiritimatiellales bacterium]|nr:hypothetical protein [Kiritimatiellales bacterium]